MSTTTDVAIPGKLDGRSAPFPYFKINGLGILHGRLAPMDHSPGPALVHDGHGFKVSLFHAATILMLVALGPGHFVTSNHIPL